MAIEEHEVRSRCAVESLVDTKQVLDRSPSTAFLTRIERSHANCSRGLVFGAVALPL